MNRILDISDIKLSKNFMSVSNEKSEVCDHTQEEKVNSEKKKGDTSIRYGDEIKRAAISSFVDLGWTRDQVSKEFNLGANTLNIWISQEKQNGRDLIKERQVRALSSYRYNDRCVALLSDFFKLCKQASEELKSNPDIDAVTKVSKIASLAQSYEAAMKATRLGAPVTNRSSMALSIMDALADHIRKEHPDVSDDIVEALKTFNKKLIEIVE